MSTDTPPPASTPLGLRLLALLALVLAVGQASSYGRQFAGIDFYQFWATGRAAHQPGAGDLWTDAQRERHGARLLAEARAELDGTRRRGSRRLAAAEERAVLETYSTPWLYTLFGVTSSGAYGRDANRTHDAGVLAYAAAVLLLARLVGFSWLGACLAGVALLSAFGPVVSDMRVGNVGRFLVAGLALAAWLGRGASAARHLSAAAVLGLFVLFKPTLAFVPFALTLARCGARDWRRLGLEAAGFSLGAGLAVGLSSAWFGGAAAWASWARTLPQLMGEYPHEVTQGNVSLARLLADLGLATGPFLILLLAAGLGYAAWKSGVRSARAAAGPGAAGAADELADLRLIGLGAVLPLIGAQLAWIHYLVAAVPLVLVLLRPRGAAAPRSAPLLAAALATYVIATEGLRSAPAWHDARVAAAWLIALALVTLFGLGLVPEKRSGSSA